MQLIGTKFEELTENGQLNEQATCNTDANLRLLHAAIHTLMTLVCSDNSIGPILIGIYHIYSNKRPSLINAPYQFLFDKVAK